MPPPTKLERSEASRALLEERLRRRAAAATEARLPRRPAAGPVPASFGQERLWFLDRFAPGSPAYNISRAFALGGPLDAAALARSVAEVVHRHEVLRTTFAEAGGRPLQVIAAPPDVVAALPEIDLRALPAGARGGEAARLREEEARRPFDLERGPLLRLALVRLAGEERELFLTLHHVVADGGSMGLLFGELNRLYGAFASGASGGASPLADLPAQYADFAVGWRERLRGDHLDRLLAYWRERLEGAATALELPADRPRGRRRVRAGGRHSFHLPASLSAAVKELGHAQGATPFMVLLAAFEALLFRLTERSREASRLVVGVPVAGRDTTESEGLIGLFVNTLALAVDLDGDPAFAELIGRVRQATLGGQAHQELPFEKLVEALAPERDLAHTPLFQVMFTLESDAPASLDLAGLEVRPLPSWNGAAKFDLLLSMGAVTDSPQGFAATMEYDRELFDETTVARWGGHLRTLLEAAVEDPSRRLGDLPLLTPAEIAQLAEWNATAADYGQDLCLHELVAAQASRTPDADAVVYEETHLSYRDLEDRAGSLADHLRALGAGPETLVAICVERSLAMVVGLLGILKSGAAYVPLDPSYPPDRLDFMLEDSAAPILLADEGLLARLTPPPTTRLVPLPAVCVGAGLAPARAGASPAPTYSKSRPDNLAYVIYTSGSTGRPKGAMNSHRAIVNRLLWMQEVFPLTPADAVLQKTPFGFDVSVCEFFAPLIAGARLVVAMPGGHRDSAYLASLIASERVTAAHFVPSMLRVFLAEPKLAACTGLRRVIASGEALPFDLQERFFQSPLTGAELLNLYGPTEAAVEVTAWRCQPAGAQNAIPIVPIGHPIANLRIHLLDARLRPVPVGVPGELHIGGLGVARGYLGRPGLTAERFVPDPFASEAGETGSRLYRTGDLARRRRDGAVEFLGRLDHQVKVRGVRVELQEIEAALGLHPGVREAAVVARAEAGGADLRLVAYVVPAPSAPPPAWSELRDFLLARLPEAMVPAAWAALDALPLSPNGKLDRRSLAALPIVAAGAAGVETAGSGAADGGAAPLTPLTPIEELLAGMWTELLGVERPGRDDGFFALGGHSLLAMRLLSRLREALGVELPLYELFATPTLGGLAARIAAGLGKMGEGEEQEEGDVPPLRPVPPEARERGLPLSFAQERLWFLDRLEPGTPLYNIPFALELAGELAVPALAWALAEIVRRHGVLRTTFRVTPDGPVQVVAPPVSDVPMELPRVDLHGLSALGGRERHEASRLARAEAERPFDLAHGPLLRALLLRLPAEAAPRHLLVLTLHHVAGDGWSLEILRRELGALYEAFAAGALSPLPPLPVQYGDFAVWQRAWLTGERRERQLAYWRRQLAGAPGFLELPLAGPRPALQTHRGARRTLPLPAATAEALAALSRRQGVTLFMTLLGAFKVLLYRHTGQADPVVGSAVANRGRVEVEGLIGLFVNLLALRAGLAGDPPFAELLGRVREATLGAHAHQDLPFERLVEELQVERDLSRHPLVQVVFSLDHAASGRAFGRPVEVDLGTVKFDLSMTIAEAPEAPEISRGLRAAIDYNVDLFDGAAIARLLAAFAALLEGAVGDPGRRLLDLPVLPEWARHQILSEWNDTRADGGPDVAIHELFAARAARQPAAAAVVFQGRTLTYRELDRRAGRLARELAARGAGRGDLVAVYLDRGPEMVVAVLAILRTGAAYLPLAASFPPERIRWILAAMGVVHIVTHLPRLAEVEAIGRLTPLPHVVCLGAPDEPAESTELDGTPGVPFARGLPAAGPDDLAYILFTSGSTGTPKGVMVRHRPVVNLIEWVNRTFEVGPSDRLLFVTALSFDLSVYDVFGILAAGGSVRIATAAEVQDPQRLARILREEPITFWDSAPAALQQVAGFFPSAAVSAPLRLVFLSGDWIPVGLPDRVRGAFPGAQVVALGGATEATVWSNFHRVEAVDAAWKSIPYGRPIANARYHVLDPRLAPCPVGVPGDLYIGGIGGRCLSLGYAQEPALTAAQYLPSPWGDEPGERLYRTGDRARHWADGTLEFLGRVDNQVKVRGFRIELGEIETVLAGHPGVREAVVLAREDTPGDQRLAAYFIPAGQPAPDPALLRRFLAERLPDYMVPAVFVARASWPLSPTGKLDRQALARSTPAAPTSRRAPVAVPAPAAAPPAAPPQTAALERTLAAVWEEVIGVSGVGPGDNFFDLGGHSMLMVRVQARLLEVLGRELSIVDLFRHPTVGALATFLSEGERADVAPAAAPLAVQNRAVAIVGMAGRFAGAADLDDFWTKLRDGVELIRFFSPAELAAAGVDPILLADPAYVPAKGALAGADLFDAAFFDYSPREARLMDPQQRLFLECAWQALEDAGYGGAAGRAGGVGVFAGLAENTYALGLYADPALLREVGAYQVAIANKSDYLATRVSYKLDLKGPSVNVQTGCSTSLAAVHLACQSLLHGECRLALAGGVSVRGEEVSGYLYEEGSIASPDGHTRAFDAAARGTVSGNGAGVVVLKRLADALADGDTVHAVVLGSAINNDGAQKVGFTAPSVDGQAEVIAQALAAAGVAADTLGYVEGHGTGTALGDPIELAGLTQAFGGNGGSGAVGQRRGFCALGSVKTNIGHLDAAAGVAGLIKTVLALEHREIPPSLHFAAPNPAMDLAASPFFVPTELTPWPAGAAPRRAGVSSFGIGGTNAHAVLEEAPEPAPGSPSRPLQLLLLSAKTPGALDRAARDLAAHLEKHPEIDLADAAHTLQAGRRLFRHRRMVVAADRTDAAGTLATLDPDRLVDRTETAVRRPVSFLFPGQGAQRPAMAAGLYAREPAFRAAFDACRDALRPHLDADLADLFDPTAPTGELGQRLGDTAVAQPALFAVEYALARQWLEWGVRPRAMLGHSLGEYVAACLAGVFPLAEALALVAARGRLMQGLPPGAMLAIGLGEAESLELLEEDGDRSLALAAVNGPADCAVAGDGAAVARLSARLAARGVDHRRLRTSRAFHSPAMDPILAPFEERVRRVALEAPALPFVSNLTGTWITAAEATDPEYWARHLRGTVRFAAGLATLAAEAGDAWLEVGPGRGLATLARRQGESEGRPIVSSLLPPRGAEKNGGDVGDIGSLLGAAGRLWLAGVEIDWQGFYAHERRRRVPLPTYPFERKRYWIERRNPVAAAPPMSVESEEAPPNVPQPEPAANPARDEIEEAVLAVWRDLLEVEEVGIHDDFFELGGTSLLAIRLASRLRAALAVDLSPGLLLEATTVARLAESIRRTRAAAAGERPAERPSCLVRLQAGGALGADQRPLFLVHQVGGHVYSFRALARELGQARPVFGLRSLGLEEGEEPLGSVEAMAAHYLALVRGVQPRGPYLLGGASMGGMVAFEMAQALLAAGEKVQLLALMDTPCGDQMPERPSEAEVLAQVRRPEGGQAIVASVEDDRLLAVLRANIAALYEYQPRTYPGEMLFFRARERRANDRPRPELPWIELAAGGCEVHLVPGNHQTMHEPPHVRCMAERLRRRLETVG